MSSDNTVIVEDDDASHVSYHPPEAWDSAKGADHQMFHGTSYHVTHAADAYLIFIFNGTYVEYYSDSNFDHGDFLVSVDGKQPVTRNSYAPSWTEGPALFTATLEPGPHTLRLTNIVDGKFTGLDYFVYRPLNTPETLVSQSGPSSSGPSGSQASLSAITPPPSASGPPKGRERLFISVLGGLAGVLLALLLGAAFMLFRRSRKNRQARPFQPLSQTVPFVIAHDPPPYTDTSAHSNVDGSTSTDVSQTHWAQPAVPILSVGKRSGAPTSPRTSRFFGSESYFSSPT
ncbi:hypothetical protein AURDEDRAFT_113637 [Auricularia subglabra TFB-10046 SS5]|nr:hypothetical protein AURDEDRAFT_113637 [Auricularia subglabra TFB-10046 SS5]